MDKFNIDYTSTTVQEMAAERASADRLWETLNEYLCKSTICIYTPELFAKSYEDLVEYVGCHASNYFFDEKNQARTYTWIAGDNDTCKFSALFVQKNGVWGLGYTGATNLITRPSARQEGAFEEKEAKTEPKTEEEINKIFDEFKADIEKQLNFDELKNAGELGAAGAAAITASLFGLLGVGMFAAAASALGNIGVKKGEASSTASSEAASASESAEKAEASAAASAAQSDAPPAKAESGWKCQSCGADAVGNFCSNCGVKKP